MMEALLSSDTSAHTSTTRRNIPEDDILHSGRCENIKSYYGLMMKSVAKDEKIG
jgi:hypothetical protein